MECKNIMWLWGYTPDKFGDLLGEISSDMQINPNDGRKRLWIVDHYQKYSAGREDGLKLLQTR